jgi:hypothetical protein
MKWLIRLYPERWRRRHGLEMGLLLDDMQPMSLRRRFSTGVDILRGAVDAHLTMVSSTEPSIRSVLRRAALVALLVWAALSVEIVLSNVVFPRPGDDWLSVLLCYLVVFGALGITGAVVVRVAPSWRVVSAAGAMAGGLIGALTILTFLVVDNAFLDIVSQQQEKIDGLAASGLGSMRAYVNLSLLFGFCVLSGFLAVAGAGLAVMGGVVGSARRDGHLRRSA